MAAAPRVSLRISMPISAAGSRPTAESTLKRPPTFCGIGKVR